MFKTERMKLMQLIALDKDVIPLCDYLIKKKVVHLVDRTVISSVLSEGTPAYYSQTMAEIEAIDRKLDNLSGWINENGFDIEYIGKEADIVIDPPKVCEEIKPKVEEHTSAFTAFMNEDERLNDAIERLTRISDALQSFETAGISYEDISRFNYFAVITGTMPRRFLSDLRRSMYNIPYHLELRTLSEDEVSLIMICTKEARNSVHSTLKSYYFSEIFIPDEYSGNPRDALDSIEFNIWSLREEKAVVNHKTIKLCSSISSLTGKWIQITKANIRVLNAMQLFGKTARTTCINGWVPERKVTVIEEELNKLISGPVKIDWSSPDTDTGLAYSLKEQGKVNVPSKFRHPAFLRPFEALITTYGYPDYDGIDPTFFVAATFLLMFGIMFGDIGHGACLAGIGIFIARSRVLKPFRNAGWLMIATGCSAIFFGFMFGSLFGYEFHDLAIWLLPLKDVTRLLGSAILIGIAIITLGIILNLIQALNRKNFKEFFFGQWGLLSGCFYWMVLGMFFLTIVKNKEFPIGITIAALLLPIVMIVIGDIFYNKLFGNNQSHKHNDTEEHSTAEVIFKPVEITLGFVTHTVSFVRVGAFALNHAALMMVVYIIADMGGGFTGPEATFNSRLSYIIAVITGNIFVMLLEGLIVFIQCLRLEYYEFFSKFFEGNGVKFEPLKIEDN